MKTSALILPILLILLSCIEEEPEIVVIQDPEETISGAFELGRALFYDKKLSADNSVSCASCHKQEFAFADNVPFSPGFQGRMSSRNSMPLQNLNSSGSVIFDSATMEQDTLAATPLFWDGREEDIFNMVLQPVTDPNELGMERISALEKKISKIPYYQEGFKEVYQTREIKPEHIADALVAFITNISSINTRFDEYQATNSGFNDQELRGLNLFFDKYDCNACHQIESPSGYLAVNNGFSNIGLDSIPADKGRQEATGLPSDAGKFKIPSLRNVTKTAPYMHDGRFETLEEVIDHYSTKLSSDPNLDSLLKDDQGNPLMLNITEAEKEAIIAFLGTLTDQEMLTNPELADPFE